MHMGAAQEAEAGLGDAAARQRAERERQVHTGQAAVCPTVYCNDFCI